MNPRFNTDLWLTLNAWIQPEERASKRGGICSEDRTRRRSKNADVTRDKVEMPKTSQNMKAVP